MAIGDALYLARIGLDVEGREFLPTLEIAGIYPVRALRERLDGLVSGVIT